ncbi:MAG TPA: phosphoglycerate mutase family protein [Pyrinomonadaceae bacterium]|nr:phosphoglycerate mutase family protein [Pyrinomonadaceae bacterium]
MTKNPQNSRAFTIFCFVLLIFAPLACKWDGTDSGDSGNGQSPKLRNNRSRTNRPTVAVIVRHAEKDVEPANDPKLNVTGQVRALHLAQTLEDKNIGAIYTTSYRRTKETAEPLATKLNMPPNIIDDAYGIADSVLRDHEGQTVLIVAHTDTIPEIIHQLGGEIIAPIAENEFDNMFIVTVPSDNSATLVARTKY